MPQWPPTFSLQKQCILTSVTDQGSVNLSVLDYIEYHVGLMVCIGFDHQHRCWNFLKSSLKTAKLFRSFLAYGLLFNLNYAPMGSKAWFAKKAAALQSFIEDHSCHTEPFLSYMPLFCAERCQVETGTVEQREAMWIELQKMRTCQIHGPLTKLMRWWSWWQSCQFYAGECWMTRLIMLHASGAVMQEEDTDTSIIFPENMTPQAELRHLKAKHGGWKLAPNLVTKQSMWERQLISELGKPMWSFYTEMCQTVKTCKDQSSRITMLCFQCVGFLVAPKKEPNVVLSSCTPCRMLSCFLSRWQVVAGRMNSWTW